ncbi:hypothetical protein [Cyanobium sp. Aljojuca 7A6]|uniref:hypothetical protein n=2 Tax=unclassified Cyanobium TaxID=2627006 RepID=UPI0020CD4A7F|nr:hypothetical protein [Cyanobium sp. Aljojuca 7A6]MCP9833980.1 hypothetical protein [Cyanobium sp. La Preciosa 7G6]MCP9936743.1 hypothetical protein [Cyanobium sp. Aljojuca 7A6]
MAAIALTSMVTARPSTPPRGPRARAGFRSGWDWRVWWIIGLCFGLSYGASLRLLSLGGEEERGASQRFDVQAAPGTTLESLRQRFGGDAREIRGDLDLLELEQQQKQEEADLEERRRGMEEREAQERQQLLEPTEDPLQTDQPAAPGAADAQPPSAPALPPPRTPPAREREASGPAPIAPPPLSAPPAPGNQP